MESVGYGILGLVGAGVVSAVTVWTLWWFCCRRRPRADVGCPGLKNLGLTCYLNAALQSLAPCTPLREWLEANVQKSPHIKELHVVLYELNDEMKTVVDPRPLMKSISGSRFPEINKQQDCHELLQHLLELIDNATQGYGSVHNAHPFLGEQYVTMQCETCHNKYDPQTLRFHSITLNILPGKSTVAELLAHYTRQERIQDVDCTKCEQQSQQSMEQPTNVGDDPRSKLIPEEQTAEGPAGKPKSGPYQRGASVYVKKIALVKLPECFCIHINKTSTTNAVTFEESLQVKQESVSTDDSSKYMDYRLVAVVVHIGGLRHGHYTTYRRGAGGHVDDWFYTSDTAVRPVYWTTVAGEQAYMLQYCRV